MILTTHAIIGAAIANAFPTEPYLGFSFSFASHYLMDIIPHTNYGHEHFLNDKNKDANIDIYDIRALVQVLFLLLDIAFSIIIVFLLFVRDTHTFYLSVVGAFLGVLPDIFNFFSYKIGGKIFEGAKKLHDLFHYSRDYNHSYIHGVITQCAIVVFMVAVSFLAISIYP